MDITQIDCIHRALELVLDKNRSYVHFDFPNHANVGDSAIWLGETQALDWFFGKPPRSTCELLPHSVPLPKLSTNTQIILRGGGSLGDLWELKQLFRERIIANYPQHRIVQLPQSIFFAEDQKRERCRKVFSAHVDFHLMTRDQVSYNLARELHNGQSYLVPDFALALQKMSRPCEPSTPILCLLRSDKEKLISTKDISSCDLVAQDWLQEPSYIEARLLGYLKRVDQKLPGSRMILNSIRTVLFNQIADRRVRRGCLLLSQGEVVITDRLHAHILCCLMEIPHVVMDNSYGKISSFRKAWGTGNDGLCLEAREFPEAISKAHLLLNRLREKRSCSFSKTPKSEKVDL
jgi:pyruvyl transferase EpsO